ncbi:DUF2238 domain-containing protein [Wenzhouxiangella sp. XN79A]|uniref:DUF2238 domain-containing protein n=1 Tax=Wenzhouxiangella sp. XN79A TaxID=2724193 RepID=UPI00144ACFC5|nr:DUF2238 domain-containing protein [Wenzhouxiangella sp. XN79A]NKI33808.1 DUF2238 domain-containing protein [Wenzhouxiangella sp. XN79A]
MGSQGSPDDRNALRLLIAFGVIWIGLAIAPFDRAVWALEHGLTVLAVGLLALTRSRLRFSDPALALIALFLVLHAIGAHFTYARVPIGEWLTAPFPQWSRNPYDRCVHLAYGLLVTPAVIELLAERAPPRRAWRFLLPVLFVAGTAAIYEVLEALALEWVDASAGERFLATQGDHWDAQWDLALAILGSIVTVAWMRGRPFAAR